MLPTGQLAVGMLFCGYALGAYHITFQHVKHLFKGSYKIILIGILEG